MYCSACGVAVTQGLAYCKNCGGKLPREESGKMVEAKPENIISMMVATFVMGLFAITGLMAVLKGVLHFEYGPLMAITMLSFLIMISLESVFVRLLFRGRQNRQSISLSFSDGRPTTRQLEAQTQFTIEPLGSVTEHTTRAFDPVLNERK
jgi:hypothetical protein